MSETKQVTLRLNDIEVRENVRSEIDTKGLDDLASSIASVGLLQPITVSPNGGDIMVLVAGHRRVAAIEAGIKDGILHPDFPIPAIVNDEAQDQGYRTVVQLIENLQRDDLPVMDEAQGYATLKSEQKLSQKDIAKRVGRSEGHISKRLKLLNLPEDVQVLVNQGEVPLEVAIELPSVPEAVARDVAKLGAKATVRDVKARKAQADSVIAKEKVKDQLKKAGITVFPPYGIEAPEGKEVRKGEPVAKVADLPKRIAGVVVNDYATDVEIVPVTFRVPSKSELEHQAEREREDKARAKAEDRERKRLVSAVDTFVDNPPSAAELLGLVARVVHPTTYGLTSTFLAGKDEELKSEGRSVAEWRLSGEMSSLEARKYLATMLVQRIEDQSRSMGFTSEEVLMGLIDLGTTVGVKFSERTEQHLLGSLAAVWARDEAAEEEAIAQAEADAEDQVAEDPDLDTETESEDTPLSEGEADEAPTQDG